MAILTDHVSLLFTSADTILGLPRVLGVVVPRIILILEVICLVAGLLGLHLSRPVSFGHVVPHHVSSCTYQFAFSLVLLG